MGRRGSGPCSKRAVLPTQRAHVAQEKDGWGDGDKGQDWGDDAAAGNENAEELPTELKIENAFYEADGGRAALRCVVTRVRCPSRHRQETRRS
jgi:hypothetical protein